MDIDHHSDASLDGDSKERNIAYPHGITKVNLCSGGGGDHDGLQLLQVASEISTVPNVDPRGYWTAAATTKLASTLEAIVPELRFEPNS